jgi:pyruvate,water dikinase
MTPRCLPLDGLDPDTPGIGGKAAGLARLLAGGLPVPPGFVVVDATLDALPTDLEDRVRALGRVAVRSSALDEDGTDASFAGQYDTVLDVDPAGVVEAVRTCLRSLDGARSAAYRDGEAGRMAVVVQQMVPAAAAGVLFTVDPASGRRDRVALDAVAGLGEALVSGEVTPDTYRCRPDGTIVSRTGDVLSEGQVSDLVGAALAFADGRPLDFEWALDGDGAVWWLQARPITALPRDPTELDVGSGDVYTRCNIGEMMPGAVSPLTLSTTGRGIEVGMQRMYIAAGALRDESDAWRFVGCTQGQMLLNMTGIATEASKILGASPDAAALAICGRHVDELEVGALRPWWQRIGASWSYGRMLASGPDRIAELRALRDRLSFDADSADALVAQLAEGQEQLYEAYRMHLISSAGSGALASALAGILAEGGVPTPEHHAEVAALLAGAEGVESADVVACVAAVAEAVPDGMPVDVAVEGPAKAAWDTLMARHGHRGYRELSMRGVSWADDPSPLLDAIGAGAVAHEAESVSVDPRFTRWPLSTVVRWAHTAVRNREATKSLLVSVTRVFRRAYLRLADLLVARGDLPDPDAVFFLTQDELVALVGGASLAEVAVARRETFERQDALMLPDVSVGLPDPIVPEPGVGEVVGKPVSRGRVQGVARVVRTLAEAAEVQPGEILVAPVTNVGWSPYFRVIGALVTDLGSAVSHGAVVAREVGLPAVVDTRVGTATFRTGERLEVDGSTGIVRRLDG